MIHKLIATLLLLGLVSCASLSPPDPVLVQKIDSHFSATKTSVYEASEPFKRPMPYEVGQFVVTGMTSDSERSVSKMAIVGKQGDGWILEFQNLAPKAESVTQMLVKGMEQAQATGSVDGLEIVWVKIQTGDGDVQTIDGTLLTMTKGLYKRALSGLEINMQMPEDGGAVRVAAGEFQGAVKANSEASFMGKRFHAQIWLHPAVPINGTVKSIHKDGKIQIELLDFGLTGAERSF